MKAIIQDLDAIKSLRPINLIGYLKAKGWDKFSEKAGLYSVWHHPLFTDNEVLVPLRREAADFVVRLAELIKELAIAEDRSQLEIIRDLHNSGFDLIRVKANTGIGSDGTIKLDDGVKMFSEAREAILAAACATVQPRPYYHARKPQQANDYMEKVRLGQTEHGSYILTMLSPVSPQLTSYSDTDLFPEDPFERKVVSTFAKSLSSIVSASERAVTDQDFSPFQAAVQNGVSANLCEALSRLFTISEARSFAVSVSWAQNRPQSVNSHTSTLLSEDIVPTIEEAARLFRSRETLDDYLLEGTIIKLERGEDDPTGKVTVYGMVENSMRKVALNLPVRQYDLAVQAHRDRQPVRVAGNITREGRSLILTTPTTFEIAQDEE